MNFAHDRTAKRPPARRAPSMAVQHPGFFAREVNERLAFVALAIWKVE
jgi:hypothetical protein